VEEKVYICSVDGFWDKGYIVLHEERARQNSFHQVPKVEAGIERESLSWLEALDEGRVAVRRWEPESPLISAKEKATTVPKQEEKITLYVQSTPH
jgi:hypothetical protein